MASAQAIQLTLTPVELGIGDVFLEVARKAVESGKQDNTIKSVNFNQHAILRDIMVLHNGGKPFDCDMTFSKGAFYGQHGDIYIPEPKYKCDVAPLRDDVTKIEPDGPLPFADGELKSIVVDLPFVMGGSAEGKTYKDGSYIISKRFCAYHSPEEMYGSYAHWLKESYRVLSQGGVCVFKTQAVVSASVNHLTPYFSCYYAQRLGFVVDDEFILAARTRLISGQVKRQQHARKYHSSFLVLKKWDSRKYRKANIEEIMKMI